MYLKSILFVVFCFSYTIIKSQNVGINTTGATPAATNLLEVLQTSTTASSVGIYSAHSGAITGTGYGIWAEKTGASTTNIAGYFAASGATNNYSIIVPSGGGVAGIGTTTPDAKAQLDVTSNGTSAGSMGVYVKQTGAAVGTGYCIRAEKTGASTVANVGAYFSASGGTANYAIIVPSSGGNVGIGTESPVSSALLDVDASDKGILIPRVALTDVSTFAPVTGTQTDGLMVYSTATPTGGSGTGFYYWSTTRAEWIKVYDNYSGGGGYALPLQSGIFTPADASSYYFAFASTYGTSISKLAHKLYIPSSGVLKTIYVTINVAGISATNETSSLYIEVNNGGMSIGGADVLISNSVRADALSRVYSNSALNYRVSAGDYIEIRWDTPTWATNPTNVSFTATLYIE